MHMARLWAWVIVGVMLGLWLAGLMLTNHRPVLVHLLPLKTICPLYLTSQLIFVRVTSHPALHNFTIESSEREANPGTM